MDVSSSFELVEEDQLPDAETLATLNTNIHRDFLAIFPEGYNATMFVMALQVVQKYGGFVQMSPTSSNLGWVIAHLNSLSDMLKDAYEKADYTVVLRIKELRVLPEPRIVSLVPSLGLHTVIESWRVPFIGNAHEAYMDILRDMYGKSARSFGGDWYVVHASIMQSSGSGKSRLIDEIAKHIFTIPINLRSLADATRDVASSYPPPDSAVHDLLTSWTSVKHEEVLRLRFHAFLRAVFQETANELRRCLTSKRPNQSLAAHWRQHLDSANNREQFYDRVVAIAKAIAEENSELEAAMAQADAQQHTADTIAPSIIYQSRKSVYALNCLVCQYSGCCEDPTARSVTSLHILLDFDDAHVLARPSRRQETSGEPKTTLDALASALIDCRLLGLFTVFLSTRPTLISPMPMPTPFSSSARLVNSPHIPHAPITETPFDCFGPRGLEPSKLRAQDACNVALMACFGRPMWRPLLLPFSEDALGRFTVGDTPDTNRRRTPSSVVIDPSVLFNDLIDLARAKLVLSALLAKPLAEYSTAAQAAVLDVRVMLSYEPHRATMHGLVMELVVGHMRTAYSLSEYGERLSTGYSSEPILAEAAARQLHEWRRLGLKLDADQPAKVLLESLREAPEPEPALKILEILRDDDQLECEEIGKAVGRLLLTLARDHATYATFPSDPCPNFSSPVPVNTFISRLFSEEVAVQVLNSKPDNMLGNASGTQKTFKEAFANAVVNFTHFTKWTGLSGLTDHVALACFVRSMAFVCETSRGIVDAFIPVLLDKDAPLDASVMTGLLVRINLSKRASAMAAYEINETTIGLFSAEEDAATVRRPYVALVMELGLAGSELAGDLTPQESPDAPPQRVSFKSSGEYWDMDEEHVHHRYSVLAYGCSPAVYGVVGEGDRALYKSVLRSGLLGALGHHPRQDATSLGLARKVSPFFGLGGGSWSWISNSYLNREVRDGLEEEGGVIIWRADGHDGDEGKRDVDEDVRMSEVAE